MNNFEIHWVSATWLLLDHAPQAKSPTRAAVLPSRASPPRALTPRAAVGWKQHLTPSQVAHFCGMSRFGTFRIIICICWLINGKNRPL